MTDTPRLMMELCNSVLTFESVDKILQCDHSNETALAVLSRCCYFFSIYNMKFGNFECSHFWSESMLQKLFYCPT